MNALNYLSILDSKWISIGNEEERLFGVIDFIAFTEFKMRFEISYYYLSEMRRTGFNYEKFINRVEKLKQR